MTDWLREFAAREAQHEPSGKNPDGSTLAPVRRDAKAMRRCVECGRLFVVATDQEQECDGCAALRGIGSGE